MERILENYRQPDLDVWQKDLIIFAAHADDVELSFWGYISKHYDDYHKIKIILATEWEPKEAVWLENLERMNKYMAAATVPHRFDIAEYTNLGYSARRLHNEFDNVKDDFYKLIDFERRFDILTHDDKDCHTDHTAVNQIAMGMYKYANRFTTGYSPSSTHFAANYWIPLDAGVYSLKKEMCMKYDIQKEQSYSKLGYYLESEEHWNIGKAYQMENFVHTDYEHYDVYRIIKCL